MNVRSLGIIGITLLLCLACVPGYGQSFELLSVTPTGWPVAYDVEIDGTTLLVGVHFSLGPLGTTGQLFLYDVADPAAPVYVGYAGPFPDVVGEIRVADGLAFLGCHTAGLQIVDVQNPVSAYIVGSYTSGMGPYQGSALGVEVLGEVAYLADHWQGLRVLDIEGLTWPRTVSITDYPYYEHDVKRCGDVLFLHGSQTGGGAWLKAYALTDPEAPAEIETIPLPLAPSRTALDCERGYAFIAAGPGGLQVVDVRAPLDTLSPGMVYLASAPTKAALDVALMGGTAFIADETEGLIAFGVEEPAAPVELAVYPIPFRANHVAAADGIVYVTDHVGNVYALRWVTGGNEPPTAAAGEDVLVECEGQSGTVVALDGTASWDPDADPLAFLWQVPEGVALDDPASPTPFGVFPAGETAIVLTVDDGNGGIAQDEVVVTVLDATPPDVVCVADPSGLWPPNHKMAEVTLRIGVNDLCGGAEGVVLRSVTVSSSEPDDAKGGGDGRTTGDTHGADGYAEPVDVTGEFAWDPEAGAFVGTLQLRAERDGRGDGRVYVIEALATDAQGNEGGPTCAVFVAHDQRR